MPTIWTMSWTVWFQFVPFYLQIKPVRRRSTFLMLVFRAYDRAQVKGGGRGLLSGCQCNPRYK